MTQQTLSDFVAWAQITSTATRIAARPDMDDSAFGEKATHWVVSLTREGFGHCRPISILFSQGSAHTKKPTTLDVMGCVIADAVGTGEGFEAWCDNVGCDTDSRKALKTYEDCAAIARKLRAFLGKDYTAALETEPL